MSPSDNQIKELEDLFFADYTLLKEKKIDFESIRNKYLGRKGLLNTLYPLLSRLEGQKKTDFGKRINGLKQEILSNLDKYRPENNQKKNESNNVDLTLPESYETEGSIHPITIIIDEIKDIFTKIGCSSIYGPEVDSDYYNFEALNTGALFLVFLTQPPGSLPGTFRKSPGKF